MIINNVNPSKLLGEFWDSGIVDVYHNLKADTLVVKFANDTDMTLVQSIIDTHGASPVAPTPSQDDFLLDLELRMTMLELGITL